MVERSRWPTHNPWSRVLWEQLRLPAAARASGVRLLHGMAFVAPQRSPCPTVVTVHDVSFVRYPQTFRRFNRIYLTLFTRFSVNRAARVIAVSQYTKDELIRLWGIPEEKISVVANGLDSAFQPAQSTEVESYRQRRGLPQRYLFFLGTLEPRKNLVRLVRAYAASDAPKQGVRLVIAGGKGWHYDQLFREVMSLGMQDDIVFPGFLPSDEIAWWYRAAEVFIYPSLYEGFGIPVLEAMACGTPVITTTSSSLPEVAGDAAILVEPTDEIALTEAMMQLLDDTNRRQTLRDRGLQRAAQFSWRRTAKETVSVYQTVLAGCE